MEQERINKSLLNSALKSGDSEAYQLIFDKHYEQLFGFVNSYTNNPHQSKDIVQEAFLRLWVTRKKIHQDASILALLHKIAYNIFIDNYRKGKREKAYLDSFAYEQLISLIHEDDSEKSKRINKVKSAINGLPPRCKEVFVMSKLEGYKYVEIAEALDISVKTVEVQMGKAFSRIRKKLYEQVKREEI